jgi:hypothetical protein
MPGCSESNPKRLERGRILRAAQNGEFVHTVNPTIVLTLL